MDADKNKTASTAFQRIKGAFSSASSAFICGLLCTTSEGLEARASGLVVRPPSSAAGLLRNACQHPVDCLDCRRAFIQCFTEPMLGFVRHMIERNRIVEQVASVRHDLESSAFW